MTDLETTFARSDADYRTRRVAANLLGELRTIVRLASASRGYADPAADAAIRRATADVYHLGLNADGSLARTEALASQLASLGYRRP